MTPKIIHMSRDEVATRISELRSRFRMTDAELTERAENYLLTVEEQADFEELRDLEFLQSA